MNKLYATTLVLLGFIIVLAAANTHWGRVWESIQDAVTTDVYRFEVRDLPYTISTSPKSYYSSSSTDYLVTHPIVVRNTTGLTLTKLIICEEYEELGEVCYVVPTYVGVHTPNSIQEYIIKRPHQLPPIGIKIRGAYTTDPRALDRPLGRLVRR